LVCSSAGLDTLADKKRAAGGGSVFKPPPPKAAVAAGSIDEDEKPAGTENDATSLSTAIRSNSSRRYRGSGSDDKTSLNGASFSLN
jgi:pre-mRNA-splicing factor ATP-dependent RNA helicase DHX38/PRP16